MTLVLASKSQARIRMLEQAGLTFEIVPASIEERAVIDRFEGKNFGALASALALQKARAVSNQRPGDTVIGSDQILVAGGKIFSKARNIYEAQEKLEALRGRTHRLMSAVSVCRDGAEIFSFHDSADLRMKNFSDEMLMDYLDKAGDVLTTCVGAYALEGLGVRLFDKIDGDYFTVLGMPLLPLLNFLDEDGAAA